MEHEQGLDAQEIRKQPSTPRLMLKVILGLVLALTVFLVAGWYIGRSIDHLVMDLGTAGQPDKALLELKSMLLDLDEAEKDMLAFAVSGDSVALDSMDALRRRALLRLDSIDVLLTDEDFSHEERDSLALYIRQRFELLLAEAILERHFRMDSRLAKAEDVLLRSARAERIRDVAVAELQPLPTNVKDGGNKPSKDAPAVIPRPEPAPAEEKKRGLKGLFSRKEPERDTGRVVFGAPFTAASNDTPQEDSTVVDRAAIEALVRKEFQKLRRGEAEAETALIEARMSILQQEEAQMARLKVLAGNLESRVQSGAKERAAAAEAMAWRSRTVSQIGGFLVLAILLLMGYAIYSYVLQSIRLRAALKTQRDRATHLANSRQAFIAHLSHEVRTPMNAIIGFSEHLRAGTLNHEQREQLEIMSSAADHMWAVVNEVLDHARLEAAQLRLSPQPFSGAEMLDGLAKLFSDGAARKGLVLEAKGMDDPPAVLMGDALRIRQICINLLANAIKFTQEGKVWISMHAIPKGHDQCLLRIEVGDTGPGIPPGKIEEIFLPYVRQAHHENVQGAGLGMAIVKMLVDLHQGKVWVDSQEGQGSTFIVELPLAYAPSGSGPVPQVVQEAPSLFDLSGLRILIADDEAFNRRLLGLTLSKHGAEILEASDGFAAVEAVKHSPPIDLAFIDLRMPGISGVEVAAQIQEICGEKLPLIAFSASLETVMMEGAMFSGALEKPFREQHLLRLINKHFPERARGSSLEKTASQTDAPPRFDLALENLRALAPSDPGFVREMLHTYIHSMAEAKAILDQKVADGVWDGIALNAHKLAGPARHLGFTTFHALLKEVEHLADRKTDRDALLKAVRAMMQEMDTTRKHLEAVIAQIDTEVSTKTP